MTSKGFKLPQRFYRFTDLRTGEVYGVFKTQLAMRAYTRLSVGYSREAGCMKDPESVKAQTFVNGKKGKVINVKLKHEKGCV